MLNANDVKYIIVGGFAVAYHGYPRYTKDIDFWVWANTENAEKLVKTIQDFGFGLADFKIQDFLNLDNVIQLGYEPNRIDIITQLDGLDFETCFPKAIQVEFEEIPLNFISFEDLIKNKLATGRPKDRLDARTLEKKKIR